MAFEKQIQDWKDMDPKVRTAMLGIAGLGVAVCVGNFFLRSNKPSPSVALPDSSVTTSAAPGSVQGVNRNDPAFKFSVVPTTNRNQGLEDLHSELQSVKKELIDVKTSLANSAQAPKNPYDTFTANRNPQFPARPLPAQAAAPAVQLDAALPPPVNFDTTDQKQVSKPGLRSPERTQDSVPPPLDTPLDSKPELTHQGPRMKVWASNAKPESSKSIEFEEQPGPVIPINSALEAVMMSGINARPSGAHGALGSATSANSVGAPFVSKIKGSAILPNSWKLDDLGDCYLGGSGVAVLSTERAYVISDTLSCIGSDGEVWEAPIKAYGLDVDGTLGVAGKVVSKQGSLLLQSALTGMASGLGNALTPTAIPAYNGAASNGTTQGVQTPNLGAVGYTAVGQGINTATAQLSKFYLEYAREIFPVVEVPSLTRITWVLKETVQLKKRKQKVKTK